MSRRPDHSCPACSPSGLLTDAPMEALDRTIRKHGWAVQGVGGGRPFEPAFCYTIGMENKGRPELIVFAPDVRTGHKVLHEVVKRLTRAHGFQRPFVLRVPPRRRVQLRPVLDHWRDVHALAARRHWGEQPFRLWQVRLPDRNGRFSEDGTCCTPPCQPLLDRDDPWQPLRHDARPSATDVLWHRVVDAGGVWAGRWETLGGVRLGSERFFVANVPFLADDVTVGDTVTAAREPTGRLVIQHVESASRYATLRLARRGGERGHAAVRAALATLAAEPTVVWECPHLPDRYWVLGVPLQKLAWAESHLRPLLREGLLDFEAITRGESG